MKSRSFSSSLQVVAAGLISLVAILSGMSACQAPSLATPTAEQVVIPTETVTLSPVPPTPLEPTQTAEPPTLVSAPEKPVLDPAGPSISVEPGDSRAVRAMSAGATSFKWELVGEGQISGEGEAVLYTAPVKSDALAVLTVYGVNDAGTSPPSSLTINVGATSIPVRLDALAIPAGFMSGGGAPATYIKMSPGDIACYSGAECLKISYKSGGVWGGIFWWPLECGQTGTEQAWANVRRGTCGISVLDAGNLQAITRLTFWARGETGREAIEFKVGAIDILPSPGRSTGKINLDTTWTKITIELDGVDMSNAIALFGWIAADLDNPNGAAFYLDDIQFEGEK